MAIKIALAGNPNCGKTSLFNELTGSSQYVGNWPGVTVEKKEGKLKYNKDVIIQDLPGIYSLSPYTLEEVVTRNYLIDEQPNVIVNIIDATNIERNLYLTTQLLELGIPVVIALNMIDVVKKNGDNINIKKLSELLNCPVVETSATKKIGIKELTDIAVKEANSSNVNLALDFSEEVEESLSEISKLLPNSVPEKQHKWYSIKIFERDEKVLEKLNFGDANKSKFESIISNLEKELDDDSESIITNDRYVNIVNITDKCLKKANKGKLSASDKIDQIVTSRILGLPIFAAIMFLIYFVSISTVGAWGTDWVNDELFGRIIPESVTGLLQSWGTSETLVSLIVDGIIGGVGAVIGFLPQMIVLFVCLSLLEDCGYMARVAFVMDRIFRKFGLSGKSFIPILIGTGCGVPGIMASRTIENESDRKMTVTLTTFIPCSAKLPIIALIAGALFSGSALISTSAYFIGMAAIIISGIILKKTKSFAGEPAPFVMELPAYHAPLPKGVLIQVWDRSKSFVKKAGTIILVSSMLIWFLSSFDWSLQMVDANDSILATIGGVIAPIFSPLGWGDWRSAVATITGLVAKENVVGTLGVLYGFEEVAENGQEIWSGLQATFTQLSAYSFLIFNLLCAPCFAAIGAIKREMGTAKWTLAAVGYQTGFAYVIALIVYQLGRLFTGGGLGIGTVVAIALVVALVYLLFRPGATPQQSKSAVEISNKKQSAKV